MIFCPYYVHVLTVCLQQSMGDVHKSLLCDSEFHKNRHDESHTLVRGIKELLSVLSVSLVLLG